MNKPNRFHQRAPRLRANLPEGESRATGTFFEAVRVPPEQDAYDALMQAARVVVASRAFPRCCSVFAVALCCGTALATVALPAMADASGSTPLLTDQGAVQRSRITHISGAGTQPRLRVHTELSPRASAPRLDTKNRVQVTTAFLPPMMPRPSTPDVHLALPKKVTVIRATRATTTPQQIRIALADKASERSRVLANAENLESAPKLPTLRNGQPLRKIITISALKQLPPASAPLPENLRAKAVSADRFKSKTTARLAQNPGAAPVRQPNRPVTNSDRLSNQIEVSVGTFVVLLTTSDLDTVAIAEPNTADVAVVNSRAVLVNGKTPGVTSLVVVDKFRIRQYQVRVVAAPGSLPRDIVAQIGLPGVGVRQVRDAIVLEGEVANPEEARRAVEISGLYATKVINQLTIRDASEALNPLASQIQGAIDIPGVRVRIVGDNTILDGSVETAAQRQRAVTLASSLSKNVIDLIELPRLGIEQIQDSLKSMSANAGVAGANLTARSAGEQIILEGDASDPAMAQQAMTLAARSGMEVVNRIRVSQIPSEDRSFRTVVEEAIGISGVRVTGNSKLAILQGTVRDTNEAMRAEQVTRAYASEMQNFLQVQNPLPVDIDVSIVEISVNDARSLGVQLGSVALTSETRTDATTQVIAPPAGSPAGTPNTVITTPGTVTRTIDPTFREGNFLAGNGFLGLGPTGIIDPFRLRLDALYSKGNARLLSNPRAIVNSGRRVAFQAGGQVPIPSLSTVGANGTTTGIEFKDFGVLVDVLPTANADGVVTMRIFTEVSQPDFANAVTPPGGGGPIPGFTRRATVTEVTVPPRGTIALSGLIQNNVTQLTSRIPVLSKIPILGKLFQSKRFQRNETELVIFVRPRVLPNPLAAGQTAPYTPTQGIDNQGTPSFGTGARQVGGGGGLTTSATMTNGGVTVGAGGISGASGGGAGGGSASGGAAR